MRLTIVFLLACCEALRFSQKWEEDLPGPRVAPKEKGLYNKEFDEAYTLGWGLEAMYHERWNDLDKLGYTVIQHFQLNELDAGLLKDQQGQCVLAFPGSKVLGKALNFITSGVLSAETEAMCGVQAHTFSVKALKKFVSHQNYSTINTYLRSGSCSKITVAGHSLGGALSPLYTRCVQDGFLGKDQEFKVDSIITFGSPAIMMTTVRNSKSEDGCFGGMRFFTTALNSPDPAINHDPIAMFGHIGGSVHPYLRTQELLVGSSGGTQDFKEYKCTDDRLRKMPINDAYVDQLKTSVNNVLKKDGSCCQNPIFGPIQLARGMGRIQSLSYLHDLKNYLPILERYATPKSIEAAKSLHVYQNPVTFKERFMEEGMDFRAALSEESLPVA